MEYRIEQDSLGKVKVPRDAPWGPQTERSRHNFKIGQTMPAAVIDNLLQIKKAAAIVNHQIGHLSADKAQLISDTVDQILSAPHRDAFPLVVFQTGSGTQTNMNVNEVITHLANQNAGRAAIHPNDDVNQSQSSNDTFPTAMMMAATQAIDKLVPALEALIMAFKNKQTEFAEVVKIGRTHLQDATPITFGQEISGWVSALQHDLDYLKTNRTTLLELPIGATAVGTGLNTPVSFDQAMVKQLSKQTGVQFTAAPNKFQGLANHTGITMVHGILKTLATDLIKVGNDIRFLASGPRAGYNELNIPSNEPGSSIMPGKVNPTQVEALTMASAQVIGHDTTINIANSQGNFEMNVYKPIIIYDFLDSSNLLTEAIESFNHHLVQGLTVNLDRMTELLDNSLMLVTALSPHIGYEKSAQIAQKAQHDGSTLKAAALASGVAEADFDQWVNAKAMTNIDRK